MGPRNAEYEREKRNPGVTEITEMKGRDPSLTIGHGRREAADTALESIRKAV